MSEATDELAWLPATALAERIRRREVSPVEVVDAVLQRIERINPSLNAFTIVRAEEAMAEARRAEVTAGTEGTGPLHGVPVTIKDLMPTAGVPTTMGSKALAGYVPTENGATVDRLLDAGGIFIGKTTTPELGHKGVTESPLHGRTNNPWNTDRIAGGSSGGAAAGMAAGLGQLALGSDGAGSIRIPASCCGVFGHKPSLGRVPLYRPTSGFSTLSVEGPITRTVADAALMLQVLSGPDDRDPFSLPDTGENFPEVVRDASIRGWRVAYTPDLGLGPVDPEVVVLTQAAARVFAESLGAEVEEATPDLPDPQDALLTIWSVMIGQPTYDDLIPRAGRDAIDPSLLEQADKGAAVSAFEYFRAAHAFRARYYGAMMRFFRHYDLLLSPTLAVPAFPHPGGLAGPNEIGGHPVDPFLGWLRTYPFNLTGQPAASVACGFSRDGLPVGLQIAGRRHADASVLRASAAYEAAAPWAGRRPPVG